VGEAARLSERHESTSRHIAGLLCENLKRQPSA
jgi:hypothetical protein